MLKDDGVISDGARM